MESKSRLNKAKVNKIIKDNDLKDTDSIIAFLIENQTNYSFFDLSKIAENANQLRMENSAYYTDEELLLLIKKELPEINKDSINVLEPSVGVGNFLPIIFERYQNKRIILDVVDIDTDSLRILKTLLDLYKVPKTIKINFYNEDFCTWKPKRKYDMGSR